MPKNPDKPVEIGRFAVGIRIFRNQDRSVTIRLDAQNEGVPQEVILMQLKAFLKKIEKEYFDNFNSGFPKTSK